MSTEITKTPEPIETQISAAIIINAGTLVIETRTVEILEVNV